VLQAKMQSGVT